MKPSYLSIDPGKRTGIVAWDSSGMVIWMGICNEQQRDIFLETLDTCLLEVVIIEEYRIYSQYSNVHKGSKVETIQVIGAIKAWARRHGIKIVEQRADIKGIAAMWAQVRIPKGHMKDDKAAYLHGYYYLHQAGIIKAKVLDEPM